MRGSARNNGTLKILMFRMQNKIFDRVLIAHFRVLVCLSLKASLRAKLSYENEFDLHEIWTCR